MSGMGDEPDRGAGVSPTTPLGSDGGDVTYPYLLINGRVPTDPQAMNYSAGQRIRISVINAAADTAFRVAMPDVAMTVTHTDGYPVVPQHADSIILGMGERADVTITMGQASVPLVGVPEREQGHAQLNLRVNGADPAGDVDAFIAALRNSVVLNTATLTAAPSVQLPRRDPSQTLDLRLTGPVNGYTWPINGKLYDPPREPIGVTRGARVRMRFINTSMMFHPMHLHGHTFAVVGPNGPAARKDTVLVPPLRTVEVDFDTDNPGRWITHCHNEYHLEAGMAAIRGHPWRGGTPVVPCRIGCIR
jgi:FtsP/CotA-like multicopper oxidase with cupredoxin domain